MPYIGNTAADRFVASKAASVYSGDGSTTAFTLEHSVGADEDILVSVDGVVQEPSVAYAVSSGTTLTFTAAPSSNSGNNIFVYYLFRTVATVDHPSTSALTATSGTFSTTLAVTGATSLTAQTDTGVVKFRTATAPTFDQNSYIYGESGFGMNIESSAIKFNVGSSRTERMRIDSNGKLLVNTTSGTGTVSITGTGTDLNSTVLKINNTSSATFVHAQQNLAPNLTANPPIATKTSGVAEVLPFPDNLEPASLTQPFEEALTSNFSAVVKFLGLDSSESVAPHKLISYLLL